MTGSSTPEPGGFRTSATAGETQGAFGYARTFVAGYQSCTMISRVRWAGTHGSGRDESTRCSETVPMRWARWGRAG
ncbi:hypothetical protein Prum_000790 [Phytohabitans rumicis]|uniref:Uncharacterized protein n=1 Tax=Phytohabitans rumicis TaxID=1076125 RepID=A0A6V8KX73_9ACTN|nr:hypothetical protein Prum_000790 [Phytohabitans rumicis]